MVKYSIIIPTVNHLEDCLKPCLEAIRKYTDLSECEIIVVANGAPPETDRYVQSLGEPFKLLSYHERMGYPKATNWGIGKSTGAFLVLLNDDAILLEQKRNRWLELLEAPFKANPSMGLTGPFLSWHMPANSEFLIFFCVMIRRQVIEKIGFRIGDHVIALDEAFGNGGCDDVDFCIRAKRAGFKMVQVPDDRIFNAQRGLNVGGFPIFHRSTVTMADIPEYQETFNRNQEIIAQRYNNQYVLGNQWERHVFGKYDDIKNDLHRREITRYKFAVENMTGKRVLELGCSAGYARRFLPEDIEYTGVDYDDKIIKFARENYGNERYKFICADINTLDWDELGYFDTIIAFEVMEHLVEGREIAQELKNHCDTLLMTTPYREAPGTFGIWHKLHWLSEADFPGFEYKFIQEDGELHDVPDHDSGANLCAYKWQKGRTYDLHPRVLVAIPTRNRYEMLAHCVQSIVMQTFRPAKIAIYDDGEQRDLREHPIWKYLFKLLFQRGIEWEVFFDSRQGQHFGHELANTSGFPFVWRIDDDCIADPDTLERLMAHFKDEKVGAVGGAVFMPGQLQQGGTGKLIDIYDKPNIQWAPNGQWITEVEHLYSSFVYRAGIVHYRLDLSPVAHREETLFSHSLHAHGYKLIVDLGVRTYHFRQDTGGIRDEPNQLYYEHDEAIFAEQMGHWGYKLINLDVGLGDHLAFSNILPALKRKYPNLIIGCCYPDVFEDSGVKLLSVAQASPYCKGQNIYKWMQDHDWHESIVKAYATMYGVEYEFADQPLRAEVAQRDAESQDLSMVAAAN